MSSVRAQVPVPAEVPSRHSSHRTASHFPEQVIGNYAIGETIGRGSFGKVKKGRHIHIGELVAIKILNRQKLKSAHMDKKIHREIEILQLFSHTNICRLYEVISTPTDMYLIMEYVEGGELYDYIVQKGHLRETEARYIFQQLVCAIEYCHHFRVVHRDLKPENVLLSSGLQVKLIDFGLSNVTKDGEFLTTSCGSPNYAAPEVISGKLYFGPEVDVWSLGVILYALLCGYLPFDEESIPLLFSKIKKGRFSIPSSMPEGPRQLIQQILVVDPLVRLTIPQIRDNAWFNQKLPMRLSYSESIFNAREDRIISVLASETAKRLNLREKEVRREIERGNGPAYVAYNILCDARRRKEIAMEVRELGMMEEVLGATSGAQRAVFEPRATERELNMGLMLTQSPAMEALLDRADATSNKAMYNRGNFVPASVVDGRASSSSQSLMTPPSKGTFSFARRPGSFATVGSSSFVGSSFRGVGSLRRPGLSPTAATQLGASLSDQPRVGSVARKHPMYTSDEEQFMLDNNYGWRIGLMTDLHAEQALFCLYDVLREFHMQWKVLSPFRLMVRTTAATWEAMDHFSSSELAGRPATAFGSQSATSAPIRIAGESGGTARSNSSEDAASYREAGNALHDEHVFPTAAHGRHHDSTAHEMEASNEGPRDPSSPKTTGAAAHGELEESSPLGLLTFAESQASASHTSDAVSSPSVSTPPLHPVFLTIYLFRIHEKHDKGFLIDFNVTRNALMGLDVVLRLSEELIRRVD